MPRPKSESTRIYKYEKDFIKYIKEKYGTNYEKYLEDEKIEEWPDHTRYTLQFKNKQKNIMQRKFGRKTVQKYKTCFVKFLRENFGTSDHLNNLENRCNTLIKQKYPDDLRYSDEYKKENSKSRVRVKEWRIKNQYVMNNPSEEFNQHSVIPIDSVISCQASVQTIDSGFSEPNISDLDDSDDQISYIQVDSNLNAINNHNDLNDYEFCSNNDLHDDLDDLDMKLIVQFDHVPYRLIDEIALSNNEEFDIYFN